FLFANGGEEKVFMGSADWMPRNLDNRIEVITPVHDPAIQAELHRIVDYGLHDTLQARQVDGTDRNEPWVSESGEPFRSQLELYNYYLEQNQLDEHPLEQEQ
ncbi:MAG: RNA degradosome polyphosphate kinase, partial [Parabacteroides sp.]|nr:RNA degradosome polyphosphate kinase [Parabacteroides sp.]